MRVATVVWCLWPGLCPLWRGRVGGLVLAVAFAAALECSLIVTFIWPGLIEPAQRHLVWMATAVFWFVHAWLALGWYDGRQTEAAGGPADEALFRQAQAAYLRGDWHEAEVSLLKLLRRRPHEIDARLLLATLYRHVGRPRDARRELCALTDFDESDKWYMETRREHDLLDRLDN